MALESGHAGAVSAFMDSLDGLGLKRQQVAGIVLAKASDGRHGLFFARRYGHTLALKAFIDGLNRLRQQNLITTQQFNSTVVLEPPRR